MPSNAARIVHVSSGLGTWGNEGAAARKMMGVTDCSFQVVEKSQMVRALGWIGASPISAEVAQSAEGSLEGVCVYEDMPTILNGFFTGIDSSTSTGAAPSGYNYPYTAPVSSTQAIFTYTLEYGTTGAAYTANGVTFNELTVRSEAGDLWQYTVGAVAKNIIASTSGLSTAMSDRAVNPVRMADTTLYVDPFSSGTMGASSVSATLINFEATIRTGRHTKTFAGSLTPASHGDGPFEVTLKTVAEFNASAKAYVDELLNTTGAAVRRQIRIGATQGSSATTKTFNIDTAGILSEGFKLFDDRDGNMTVALTWNGVYSTGLGNSFACNVVNGSSSTT